MRVIDIEIDQASPLRLNAVYVKNEGPHQKGWWWYYGLTTAQVTEKLNENRARLIDVETYVVDGRRRYAVVMVSNTGSATKGWWWYVGSTINELSTRAQQNNARIIDVEPYSTGEGLRYAAIMISNTGADASGWWWYVGQTAAEVGQRIAQTKSRILDIETYLLNGQRRYAVVLVPSNTVSAWWWYYGITASSVASLTAQNGARLADIQSYTVNGNRRFAVMMLNNSNALTTRIATILRYGTDGATGLYLRQLRGPTHASLQESRRFETASSIKVAHLVHALTQVDAGNVGLGTQIPWCNTSSNDTSPKDGCPDAPCGMTIDLESAMRRMMQVSDNRTTDAILRRFGRDRINATMDDLGMTRSILRHQIGCGNQILDNPNHMTLRDAGRLYGEVIGSNFLSEDSRNDFHALMLNESNSGLIDRLRLMAMEEAAAAGCRQRYRDRVCRRYPLRRQGRQLRLAGPFLSLSRRLGTAADLPRHKRRQCGLRLRCVCARRDEQHLSSKSPDAGRQ